MGENILEMKIWKSIFRRKDNNMNKKQKGDKMIVGDHEKEEFISAYNTDYLTEEKIKEICQNLLRKLYPNGHPSFIPLMLELMELHSKKNKAYTQGGKPLGNFDRRGRIASEYNRATGPYLNLKNPVVVSVWDMFKQLDAAMWQLSQGYNDDIEGVRSRLRDVVVYGALAIVMLDEQNSIMCKE